jgi:peptidoglycan hydrolase-like protein with peptidoglycan-binding domain
MSDPMVLATQQWLNATYGNDSRFNKIDEDGSTGWQTIYALTRALQIELGIQSTADAFGPSTQSLYSANPIAPNDEENNKNAILQGALWCKGYAAIYGDTLDNTFPQAVADSVLELKADAGVVTTDATVTTDFMKGLLSMDQYKLVASGDENIREFQQFINQNYEAYTGIIPCDGIYDRNTNLASIYVLQAMEGMPVGTANGNFGPGTKSSCPAIPYSGAQVSYNTGAPYTDAQVSDFTYLLNFCLYVNGFKGISITRTVDTGMIELFQTLCALDADGYAGLQTWSSLLVSYGDNTRRGTACDTRFPIDATNLAILKANGYTTVGRYITPGVIDGVEKSMSLDELSLITEGGLSVFPIFEYGYDRSYFTEAGGVNDGEWANQLAESLNLPYGTVIYFTVDFDALDADVTTNVLPYFKGLSEELSTVYQVGIYGARNVCARVCEAGYAVSSFISDMSSGFSGNMGYPLPSDWGYDQISNIVISDGAGHTLEIDNDIMSERAKSVSSIYINTDEDVSGLTLNDKPFNSYARVNMSNTSLSVYDNEPVTNGIFTKIGEIKPGEMFVAWNNVHGVISADTVDLKYIFGVLFRDSAGKLSQGYVEGNDPDTNIAYPWLQDVRIFQQFASNGTSLVEATELRITETSDPDGKEYDCYYNIHTLQRALSWCYSTVDSFMLMPPLPAGAQITIKDGSTINAYDIAGTGKTHPQYISATSWRLPDSIDWKPFVNVYGTEIPKGEAFVSLGMEFGVTPSDRVLW